MISRRTLLGLMLTSIFSVTANAQSANWPNKSIKVIVPYPTAGVSDTIVRIVSERLSAVLGQSIIVENKPGAGGRCSGQISARWLHLALDVQRHRG